MADQNAGAAESQADEATQPQAGASQPQAGEEQSAPAAGSEGETTTETLSLSEARELRRELQTLRKRAKEAEEKVQNAESANLSELERAKRKVAALEQEIAKRDEREREHTVQDAAMSAAVKLGYRNPEVAFRLLDRDAIEFNDTGRPKNVERLLKDLAEKEPYLVKPATGPDYGGGNRGTTPSRKPDMNTLLKVAARGGTTAP